MLSEQLKEMSVVQALDAACPGAILAGNADRGETTLEIAPPQIAAVCRFLKDTQKFVRLSGVTATDWYPMEPRFHVLYHLHSLDANQRLRLKCKLPGDSPIIDSVISVWRAADWYEREVFDLFGVTFNGHPNLKRILMPDDWKGHPLRKDFPVHGHKYDYANE
ncbi:MAG: NADH-quinone oxidoreductase subunit C [Acidimicrobiia bacterium]|nr:NADH-quinone oxidoreductase subunit C [Acidimicrobiia bacterium]